MALDILDNINKEHKKYKKMQPEFERLQTNRAEFLLDNQTWTKYYKALSPITFNWNEVKYSDIADGTLSINTTFPNQTGIYVLLVRPINLINDLPKYVFYVGIAGATASANTLQSRITNYFQLSQIKKRDSVQRLIYKFFSDLYIAFTPLNLPPTQLAKVEENLIGFYGTHIKANKDDAPIDLKPQQKAFTI